MARLSPDDGNMVLVKIVIIPMLSAWELLPPQTVQPLSDCSVVVRCNLVTVCMGACHFSVTICVVDSSRCKSNRIFQF